MSVSKPVSRVSRRQFLRAGAALAAATALGGVAFNPVKTLWAVDPKRIYLAPDDHTDLWWTASDAEYRQAFVEMLDYYLDLADTTASERPEFQSRWNCDGSYWLWTYERTKPAGFNRLMSRVRDGHISVPLNALVVCLGGAPAEAVLRGMYYAGSLERRFNLRLPVAISMENQTLPYGLTALWAGSGARYSWKGVCACDTQVSQLGNRDREIYWHAGPDGSRVLMKWNSLLGSNESIGGYAEARNPASTVDFVDTDPGFLARYPYRVVGAFGKGWDDFKTLTDEFVQVARAKTTASRTVIVSNQVDFFNDFETSYGSQISAYGASFGNEWDTYCASLAEVSARVKRSVERLRAAEALASLVSLASPAFMAGRAAARDQAWMSLGLYWEHNFGMVGFNPSDPKVIDRIQWQRDRLADIEGYVNTLATDAAAALGGLIRGSGQRFFAFNPLSWTRTDVAELPYTGASSLRVIDLATGQETPSELDTVDGRQVLRIVAANVPPLGYKVFEIRGGPGITFSPAAQVSGAVVENEFYRLTLADRGALTSLVDKTRGNREFVRSIGGRTVNDLATGAGQLRVEHSGPVSVTLLAQASAPLSRTTRIRLLRGLRRIEIRNEIQQNFVDTYTWGFGFNLDNPDVNHEEVGAIARARLQPVGHYATQNARYDWLTFNHFADMNDGSVGVTLSNADCYFMGLGNSRVDSLDVTTPQIQALVGGRVGGGGGAGLPNQGGDSYFLQRFALQTHGGYDPSAAMRFALEHQNPLVTGMVTGGSVYPETSSSLLTIDNPNVLLWALKPADDGIAQGLVARVWNVSAQAAGFRLSLPPFGVADARWLSHIETPLGAATRQGGALVETLAAQQIKTFALVPGALPPATVTPTPTATPTPPPCNLTGDVNHDGRVDSTDVQLVAQHWPARPAGPADLPFDVTGDGNVDVADIMAVAARLGQTCP